MRQYNKRLPYIGLHHHEDDVINTFLSSLCDHNGTTAVELNAGTKKLLTYVYGIGSNSGLNIYKVLQYQFHECGIPINIWTDISQEVFMWSVRKLLCTFWVEIMKSEVHKYNQNPTERFFQEIKCTKHNMPDRFGAPSCSWLLCMAYFVVILICMAHNSLSWSTPHKAAHGFTLAVEHLI